MNVQTLADPKLRELADRLPIMRDGKPRRFRLFCECYEWTFTQVQRNARALNNHFVSAEHLTSTVEPQAVALWHWQNPQVPA